MIGCCMKEDAERRYMDLWSYPPRFFHFSQVEQVNQATGTMVEIVLFSKHAQARDVNYISNLPGNHSGLMPQRPLH